MPDLTLRSDMPEKMDQPGVEISEIHTALRELETINKRLGGYKVILNALDKLNWPDCTVRIMDIGCGGGDMLRAIAEWADKKGRSVELLGVDINPVMTKYAQERSAGISNIRFRTINVFDDALLQEKTDITMNSLFCHHFDDAGLIHLVKRMYELSALAVVINDIHRHWLAYHSIRILTALFSKTYLVRYDAPLSVARSLTKKEWEYILQQAEIKDYELHWMWAWRWQLIINK